MNIKHIAIIEFVIILFMIGYVFYNTIPLQKYERILIAYGDVVCKNNGYDGVLDVNIIEDKFMCKKDMSQTFTREQFDNNTKIFKVD